MIMYARICARVVYQYVKEHRDFCFTLTNVVQTERNQACLNCRGAANIRSGITSETRAE